MQLHAFWMGRPERTALFFDEMNAMGVGRHDRVAGLAYRRAPDHQHFLISSAPIDVSALLLAADRAARPGVTNSSRCMLPGGNHGPMTAPPVHSAAYLFSAAEALHNCLVEGMPLPSGADGRHGLEEIRRLQIEEMRTCNLHCRFRKHRVYVPIKHPLNADDPDARVKTGLPMARTSTCNAASGRFNLYASGEQQDVTDMPAIPTPRDPASG